MYAELWHDIWCDECGGYLCDGALYPHSDAQNIAQRHEDYAHGGALTCVVSAECV